MTSLVKGRVKPPKPSFSRKHDDICVGLYRQWGDISKWVTEQVKVFKEDGWDTSLFDWVSATLEFPITKPGRGNRPSRTLGFMDMFVQGEMVTSSGKRQSDACIIYEVKPVITSLGEVLRQVHRYRDNVNTYCGSYAVPQLIIMAVVSSSTEYADVLSAHGIVFIDSAWLVKRDGTA